MKDEKLIAVSLKTRKKRFISIYYCGRNFRYEIIMKITSKSFSFIFFYSMIFMEILCGE